MKFTKQKLLALKPCADGLAYAESLKFDFVRIYDECERGDWLIWLLRKSRNLDKPKAVELAIVCARHVLEIFEKKYPEDKRPRQALKAAEKWLSNPTEENRKSAAYAAAAAYAAYAYASPASAAYAYASAAYAAYAYASPASACTAACTAAAAAAAYAAADAYVTYVTAADRNKERKWQANKIREIITNPFK
jgi:hypothetical protein